MRLFDYIESVQYDSFYDLPLTPPDLLALAELSYIEYERFMTAEDSLRFAEMAPLSGKLQANVSMTRDDLLLLQKMSKSKRYRNIKVTAAINDFKPDLVQQFAACSYELPCKIWIIAFRGTDDTLIGWKEDMHLFYSKTIPSQKRALDYLEQMLLRLPESAQIHLVGHSKGGHLAVHAASQLDADQQKRIQSITTFDSPGHHNEDLCSPGYRAIKHRIKRYSPRGSMVSQMLDVSEPVRIIACRASTSFAQHNPYIWQIDGHDFRLVDGYNEDSKQIKKTLEDWTSRHSEEEMKAYIDTLFHILLDAEIETTTGFLKDRKFKQMTAILKNWQSLSKEERRLIFQLSNVLVSIRTRHWRLGWKTNPKVLKILKKITLSNKIFDKPYM